MATVMSALARLRHEPLVDSRIACTVEQHCREKGLSFRDRVFSPLVTLRLFILQVLHGNTAITHLRHLAGVNFSPSSYCEARRRLPLALLQYLLREMANWARERVAGPQPLLGQRVLIADGSSATTFDTPHLRGHFGLPRGQKPGVGYPMAKLMGLMDAATGMFLQLLALPLFQHDLRGMASLHCFLRPSDILLGDRALCSFAQFALLNAAGAFGCFRLHQRRKNLRPGWQAWTKDKKRPAWISDRQYALLPSTIAVRIVRYVVAQPGFRVHEVFVATTLGERQWPDQAIADLYARRWSIELCFRHLKTTMKMDMLKCQSLDGVLKELMIYLMVYNLTRLVMIKAAAKLGVDVDRVSFVDALRCLGAFILGHGGVDQLIVNPLRPGRSEPRVIRRRKKQFDMMNKPREAYRQAARQQEIGA